ncbi:hypothetical protein L7F22_010161 [Adiantum nelumboides]|nr:hypothetical protein [Adiantum nelumboides]
MLPLPPSRPLFPSSLKFLWFGRDNPSQAPDHTSSKPLDDGDSDNSKDTVDSESHLSNLSDAVHMDTIQTSNLEDRDEVAKQVARENKDSAILNKRVDLESVSDSGWLSRLLQLRLLQKDNNSDQLKTSKGLVESVLLLNVAEKEADHTLLDRGGEDFTELRGNIAAVHNEPNGLSYVDGNNIEKEDELGLCMLETSEKRVAHDRESVSEFLHEVPITEVRAISKLCLLSNLAYIIPEVQSKDLLKDHHLTFLTSSLVKKEEAEVHASLERAIMQASKQKSKANKGEKNQQLKEATLVSDEDGYIQVEPAKATSSNEDMLPCDTDLKGHQKELRPTFKIQGGCPCEWFICDDEASSTRFLVIQGSESLASWQTNLSFDPTKFEGLQGVLVHRGIYEAAQGLYEMVEKEMVEHARKGSHARLCFTGHSLGGSLATLIAMMLVKRGAVAVNALEAVVTLGAPCVLCAGERLLRQLRLQNHQFVNIMMHRDIVPRAFACDYPRHVARLLQRFNGTFRDHPCLNFQHLLYTPIGQVMVLQPDDAQSPSHPLLPSKEGLYLIRHPPHEDKQQQQLADLKSVKEVQRAFFNMPHPLEMLRDPGAYGFEGAISRDHDPRSYKRAINTILVKGGLRRLGKVTRQSRHFLLATHTCTSPHSLPPSTSLPQRKRHPLVPSQHVHMGLFFILSNLLSSFVSWA